MKHDFFKCIFYKITTIAKCSCCLKFTTHRNQVVKSCVLDTNNLMTSEDKNRGDRQTVQYNNVNVKCCQ